MSWGPMVEVLKFGFSVTVVLQVGTCSMYFVGVGKVVFAGPKEVFIEKVAGFVKLALLGRNGRFSPWLWVSRMVVWAVESNSCVLFRPSGL